MKILFGPAGSAGLGNLEGIKKAKSLSLGAFEVEFTYGVKMANPLAKQCGKLAKDLNIKLSVHAPYYINLASEEKKKITASKKRILMSCERAHYLGARYVVFHAAYYQKDSPEQCYKKVAEETKDMNTAIKKNKWNVKLTPETTGKASQFGTVDELMKLKKETGCYLCIDFAHLYARNLGKIDYDEIFKKIKSLNHIHSHFSGITYTQKGERSHKPQDKAHFLPLAKAIKKAKPKSMTIINESPFVFRDAVKMKKWFSRI